jgi:hypothetical protein
MQFNYRYFGNSSANSSTKNTNLSFAPDSLRDPTFFVADLRQHLDFREAISALHDVVISDLRFQPKDRTEYLAWVKQEEQTLVAEFLAKNGNLEQKIRPLREELGLLNKASQKIMAPYYTAQREYFNYLYKTDKDAWFVLDPVITVHPDEVFFECFSQDESSYGRLSCNYEVFKNIDELACGTTNIDYSEKLYQEFQKIRDYRNTQFKIDPSGFEVETEQSDQFIEQKIDLPDSWVRGFLQVNSAMTLPLISFDLHPMDVHNICFLLRRKKEREGPRSLRFKLKPGKPIEILFEPWNKWLTCPRSIFKGDNEQEIRIWGRRRLFILERLIAVAKKFTVRLLGTGLPSFWIADLGDMKFTLGLSGWTANDWSKAGNFDLMAPRGEVDSQTAERVISALHKHWQASAETLAKELQLEISIIKSALSVYAQHGRVLFDTENKVYRLRELSREALPMDKLRFSNPREEKANQLIAAGLVKITKPDNNKNGIRIQGQVKDNGKTYILDINIDNDQRLFKAKCDCDFYKHNQMHKGPCEHMLALRISHQ